jgi:hypothetical protein
VASEPGASGGMKSSCKTLFNSPDIFESFTDKLNGWQATGFGIEPDSFEGCKSWCCRSDLMPKCPTLAVAADGWDWFDVDTIEG